MTVTFLCAVDSHERGTQAVVSPSLARGLINLGYACETATVRPIETATRFTPKPTRKRKK